MRIIKIIISSLALLFCLYVTIMFAADTVPDMTRRLLLMMAIYWFIFPILIWVPIFKQSGGLIFIIMIGMIVLITSYLILGDENWPLLIMQVLLLGSLSWLSYPHVHNQ